MPTTRILATIREGTLDGLSERLEERARQDSNL